MDESKRYTSITIPPREMGAAQEVVPDHPAVPVAQTQISFDDGLFAEIEYNPIISKPPEPRAGGNAAAQQIGQRVVDPIRQKFYDMRNLAAGKPLVRDDTGLVYKYVRNDADVFYRQAKFMEDYTDDYEGNVSFAMAYPFYQHMRYEQLRTYFTWRTKVRQGDMGPAALSYIMLYMFELLSNIGVADPTEGLDKLIAVWQAYRELEPALDEHVPLWIKDYHIYYGLPHDLRGFMVEHNLQMHCLELFLFDAGVENSLLLWNHISSYDVTKSKFYIDGNEGLFQDCFDDVLSAIQGLCERRHLHIVDFLVHSVHEVTTWYPFPQALFMNWMEQPDRQVEISAKETYHCKSNNWTAFKSVYFTGQNELVGFIIKRTEVCLRQAVKYKFKITADPDKFYASFQMLKKLDIPVAELNSVIEEAVVRFHQNLTRTVVTVDHQNLARIRQESKGTQDKLTVEDVGNATPPVAFSDTPLETKGAMGLPNGEASLVLREVCAPQVRAEGVLPWGSLRGSLSLVELQALSIILQGGDIKAFADTNKVMLEVLADGINGKAVDCIGDNIVECADDMVIYDEYKEKIAEMVK